MPAGLARILSRYAGVIACPQDGSSRTPGEDRSAELVETYAETSAQLGAALAEQREQREVAVTRLDDVRTSMEAAHQILLGTPFETALVPVLERMTAIAGSSHATLWVPDPGNPPRAALREFEAMPIHTGHVYKAGRSKKGARVYKARWYPHPGSKRKMKNFSSRRAAEAFLKQLYRDETTGSSVSFKALVVDWRDERTDRCKPTTQADYDRTVRVYLMPEFGDRRDAASITPLDIQRLNQKLIATGKSVHVRTQVLGTLRLLASSEAQNRRPLP